MTVLTRSLTAFTAAATLALALGAAPAAADDLEKIKEAGKIRIAMSGAYPPFNFVNEQNEVVGFDPSIGKAIAEKMGVEAEIITTPWDGIIGGLLANKFDAVVGSMSITEERKQAVDFVGPYYSTHRDVFVKEDSPLQNVSELSNDDVTLGVTLGETHDQWAREQGYSMKTYKGLPELLMELDSGRVDAIANDTIPVMIAIKDGQYKLRALEGLDSEKVDAGIAIRRDNPELHAAMQAALDEIMADGTYMEIANDWVGGDIR